ncbi:MAG: hypothetical protein HQL49_03860 [Gammaproteobacteria bacterium]|nr:hypothetical protein [Gammaproteobacteria bacterium]
MSEPETVAEVAEAAPLPVPEATAVATESVSAEAVVVPAAPELPPQSEIVAVEVEAASLPAPEPTPVVTAAVTAEAVVVPAAPELSPQSETVAEVPPPTTPQTTAVAVAPVVAKVVAPPRNGEVVVQRTEEPKLVPAEPIAAQGATQFPDLAWMKVEKLLRGKWQSMTHAYNENWLLIWPANSKATESRYSIVVAVSKESKSYVLALDKLLEVLQLNGISAALTIVNIDTEALLMYELMRYAEAEKANLIFSMGSQAEVLLHDHYRQSSIAVVTCTNKDPVLLGQIESYSGGGEGSNIAYTSLNVPLTVQMQYLRLLRPNIKVIGLMYDKNHKEVMETEVGPTKKLLQEEGVEVVDVAVEDLESAAATLEIRMPEAVAEMRAHDPDLKNSLFLMTSSTAIFSHTKTINNFSGNIPVVAAIPNAVTTGADSAVLAFGIDRRSNAHLAAQYAVSILRDGVKPADLQVGVVTPPDISVNFMVAKKIGLKIPFHFLELATSIYNYEGKIVRDFGKDVPQ